MLEFTELRAENLFHQKVQALIALQSHRRLTRKLQQKDLDVHHDSLTNNSLQELSSVLFYLCFLDMLWLDIGLCISLGLTGIKIVQLGAF